MVDLASPSIEDIDDEIEFGERIDDPNIYKWLPEKAVVEAMRAEFREI